MRNKNADIKNMTEEERQAKIKELWTELLSLQMTDEEIMDEIRYKKLVKQNRLEEAEYYKPGYDRVQEITARQAWIRNETYRLSNKEERKKCKQARKESMQIFKDVVKEKAIKKGTLKIDF